MMARVLVFLAVSLLLSRAFWRIVAAFMEGLRGERPGSAVPPTHGVQMARDPVCGTFVVPDRAVALNLGRQRLYFCSNACRDAYRAGRSTGPGRPEDVEGRTA
jgi:hypothetical protein